MNKIPLPSKLSKGSLRTRQKDARNWYKEKIKSLGGNLSGRIQPGDIAYKQKDYMPIAGQIVMFEYDAKWKKKLPYWDIFPMAMVIDISENSWLALNLHYLPYNIRFVLIERMIGTINNDKFNDTTKSSINYGLVKGLSAFKIAAPAIKRHLFKQMRSRVTHIHPNEWGYVASLPLEQFVGASSQKVWADSMRKLK